MPTYEYQCPDGHTFEKFQKITEKPRTKCPLCGKLASRKISGGAGLVFKGSGFYITDYGRAGKKPPEGVPGEPRGGAEPAKREPAKTETPKSESKGESQSDRTSRSGKPPGTKTGE